MFRVLRHPAWIQSFPFVSVSPTSRPDLIPSFCFWFSNIKPEFDPFVLFLVLRHCAWIQSLRFVSGSPISRPYSILIFFSGSSASCLDSIPSFCFWFSVIVPGFYYLFQHHVRIFPIFLGIVSEYRLSFSASCLSITYLFSESCMDFPHLPRHRVQASLIFFGIASGFHYLFRHRVWIFLIFLDIVCKHRLSFSASHLDFAYLFWHRVQIFLIFLGIVFEHQLSFSASCLTFIIFFGIVSGFSSSSSASCPSIAYIFRHRVRISPIFIGIVSGSLIFPGIVLGFLLVLQSR